VRIERSAKRIAKSHDRSADALVHDGRSLRATQLAPDPSGDNSALGPCKLLADCLTTPALARSKIQVSASAGSLASAWVG
jgi:hypothetical protein